tara:strand:+ start:1714 stop:1971 length:258 start_codon:yes stop_codon:yes gene_type:complete
MNSLLQKITKQFLMNESYRPDVRTYLQSLNDLMEQIRPNTKKDSHRLHLAKENLTKIKKYFRKMEEHVSSLEEQLRVIEEGRESK